MRVALVRLTSFGPWVLASIVVAGCATTPRPTTPAPSGVVNRAGPLAETVARAETLAAAGCYTPMGEALALYTSLLPDAAADRGVRRRAFRLAVLLALRERRLGVYPGRYQDAPRALAGGLDAADTRTGLELLDLVDWRRGTGAASVIEAPFPEVRRAASRLFEALRPQADTDPIAAAWLMQLLAAQPYAPLPVEAPLSESRRLAPSLETWPWVQPFLDGPLVRLIWLDLAGASSPDDWAVFHAEHPTCDEALLFQGDAEVARRRLGSADGLLGAAIDALPGLVPARVMRGEIRSEIGDYDEALAQFRAVTARLPEHREAALGALVALSRLGRHDEAIAAADRLIGLGEWYLGEAFYWRAWNLFQQRRLGEARISLTDARRLLHSAEVYYLAGLIAYQEESWQEARRELAGAVELEPGHCDARFTLAAVHLIERRWPDADAGFAEAEACFTRREPALVAAVADAATAALAEAQRAAVRARRQQALDACREQQRWARYNRAVALANRGAAAEAQALAADVARQAGPAASAAAALLTRIDALTTPAPPRR